jgi:hypothetical protein
LSRRGRSSADLNPNTVESAFTRSKVNACDDLVPCSRGGNFDSRCTPSSQFPLHRVATRNSKRLSLRERLCLKRGTFRGAKGDNRQHLPNECNHFPFLLHNPVIYHSGGRSKPGGYFGPVN